MDSITVGLGPQQITLSDERTRAALKAPAGAFASVTLESDDSSWGEFLTREDAFALLGWLSALVTSPTPPQEEGVQRVVLEDGPVTIGGVDISSTGREVGIEPSHTRVTVAGRGDDQIKVVTEVVDVSMGNRTETVDGLTVPFLNGDAVSAAVAAEPLTRGAEERALSVPQLLPGHAVTPHYLHALAGAVARG